MGLIIISYQPRNHPTAQEQKLFASWYLLRAQVRVDLEGRNRCWSLNASHHRMRASHTCADSRVCLATIRSTVVRTAGARFRPAVAEAYAFRYHRRRHGARSATLVAPHLADSGS